MSRPPPPPSVLAGYVTDAETHLPLAGVTLTIQDWDTLDGRSPTCTTDDAGRFRFKNLRPSDDPRGRSDSSHASPITNLA